MEVFIRTKRYRGPVQAVVLDWAGTGIDHGCFGPVQPIVEAFARHGVELDLREARGPMGLAKKDHVRAVLNMPSVKQKWQDAHGQSPCHAHLETHFETTVEAIYKLAEDCMLQAVSDYAIPIEGAVETLNRFRQMGLKIGSSTGYTAEMMAVVIKEAARHGYVVDSVLTADAVGGQGRPFPFMMYQNAINLGVYPMEAVVKIGDTPVDIAEGLNAGAWTIGVTHTSSHLGLSEEEAKTLPAAERAKRALEARHLLEKAGAHFVVSHLKDCPEIIRRINSQLANGQTPLPVE